MGQSLLILVDTHIVVWLALEPQKLSSKAKAAIAEARGNEQGLAISDISLWELTAIVAKNRIQLDISLESFLEEVESRFIILPITSRICARAAALPARYPKDPADRIIGSAALVHGVPLVTGDREIRRSKLVQTIW